MRVSADLLNKFPVTPGNPDFKFTPKNIPVDCWGITFLVVEEPIKLNGEFLVVEGSKFINSDEGENKFGDNPLKN